MRRLLVTGGAGFIGCNFVQYWMKQYPSDRVVVLDALTYAGKKEHLASVADNPNFCFVHGNICDQPLVEALMRKEGIDTIVHFAAESHVDRSIEGPDLFVETNIIGTHTLLKVARQLWIEEGAVDDHRFHHVSTDEVYGALGPNDPPFTEETPYAPNSPYSASKASSDHLVRAYNRTYGLKTSISNCSNNYGPYQDEEKLIPKTIQRVRAGEPIPVYGDGSNIRDWLHVEDHCRAIELILNAECAGEVFNVGGGEQWSNLDLVKLICQKIDEQRGTEGSERLITFVEDRKGHDWRYDVDCGKLMGLGYEVEVLFVEKLEKIISL